MHYNLVIGFCHQNFLQLRVRLLLWNSFWKLSITIQVLQMLLARIYNAYDYFNIANLSIETQLFQCTINESIKGVASQTRYDIQLFLLQPMV